MEKEKLNKKQIIPLVIGVLTMIILVSSATYAYFKVSIGNTATSTTITGDIGGGTLGTVTLSGGGTNLYLGVSAYDMSESKKGTTYYSSTTEGSRETNINNAGKTTYTATLTGDESDSVMYACDYEFTVTSTGTAIESENLSDIEVIFEGDINRNIKFLYYDFEYDDEGNSIAITSETVSGTWYGFKNSNKERSFNAYLQFTNTDSEQNSLAGTNLSVSISNTKWNCYLNEFDELPGEAYALMYNTGETYDAYYGGIETAYGLAFVRSETPYEVGDTYNDKKIVAVYTGFENTNSVPWRDSRYIVNNVVFEDEIRPISTAYWFYSLAGYEDENWNWYHIYDMDINIDVTNLNTSLVTDMSYMFNVQNDGIMNINGLDNWDISNVTNMSNMFGSATFNMDIGISNWDVSKVTNMSGMFNNASINYNMDLSGWDISNVINYEDFNYNYGKSSGTGTFIPPSFAGYWGIYSETDYSLRLYYFDKGQVPYIGDTYEERTTTAIYSISSGGTPVKCSSTIVPTSIIAEDNIIAPTHMFSWFEECTKVNEIDLSKLDTSNVTYMNYAFKNVGSDSSVTSMTITGIDSFKTSKVTWMYGMFYNFGKNATYTLDLSGWDVSKVTSYSDFNYGVTTKVIAPSKFTS